MEDCFFDQTARPNAYNPGQNGAVEAAQLSFDGSLSSVGDIGPTGSNWQVLGCAFKPFAGLSITVPPVACATACPCIEAVNGAKNIYVAGCVYVPNDYAPNGVLEASPLNVLFNSDVSGGLANHRFAANCGILAETKNYVAAVGYTVGPTDTSIPVVFPTTQTSSQYEVCPQFYWDAGNWNSCLCARNARRAGENSSSTPA
jgi:hypothetical protein